ncbi:TIGR02281 family clan AA aspartic protease [Pseudomaricurvus alcaniphilus]|nr:TIGR02281 family clan AA aspartic protease [Pseudomaricurvus alcaniphilus]
MQSPDNSPDTRGMGRGMLIVFWLLVMGILTWWFGSWEGQLLNPNQQPVSADTGQYREVILESNRQHHYVASGLINGEAVTFLLDTGATDVVIPAQLARRLQLQAGQAGRAMTANGLVTVYSTRLDNLQLGSIRLYDVAASINPGMSGDGVLLGMSALRNIEFSQRQGQLILRQPTDAR